MMKKLILLMLTAFIMSLFNKKFESFSQSYAETTQKYTQPFVLNYVLTQPEILDIINYSKNRLVESETVGGKDKNIRNSMQCWIPKTNPLVKDIFERMAKKFGIPFENAEDLQVVRYYPNQFYNEHHDSCCDDSDSCKKFIERGGQRKLTILIYLNDKFEGGSTYFKNLNLTIKPKSGDAVVFYPLADGTTKCHPLALHSGMPVSTGEKWIANLWFRENKFI